MNRLLASSVFAVAMVIGMMAGPAKGDRRDDEIAAVKARIVEVDRNMEEEQDRFQRVYARMPKNSPEAAQLVDQYRGRMATLREQRADLDRQLAILSAPAGGEIHADARQAEILRQKIHALDEQITFERDRYLAEMAGLDRNSRRAMEVQYRYDEKVKALGAERYQLMRQLAAIKVDAQQDAKELREALAAMDAELAEAKQRVVSLEARRQRLAAELEMLERPRAMQAAEIRGKLAELAKAQSDEDAAFSVRVNQINTNRYRLITALKTAGLSLNASADLRARLAEQDRALEGVQAEHTHKVSEFEAYRARLENELDRMEGRRGW